TPLLLGLTESADPVAAGDTLEYALTFGNRGTTTQLGAELVVTLPAGLTPMATDGGVLAGDTVTWTLGDLGPGQVGERRLRAMVDDLGSADPLVRVTRALVTSGVMAARASAVTTREPPALGLVMAATPNPGDRGALLTYALTVTNHRAVDASDVQLVVPVPEVTGCPAVCDAGVFPVNCVVGVGVTWSLGALPAPPSRPVEVTFGT